MVQVSVLLETEEVISKGFLSSKSARLHNGAIRKVQTRPALGPFVCDESTGCSSNMA